MPGGRCPLNWIPARLRDALQRHLFGLTADEIRYTFEDVRQELRAMHAELRDDIAAIRRDVDRLSGKSASVPAVAGEHEADPVGDEPPPLS